MLLLIECLTGTQVNPGCTPSKEELCSLKFLLRGNETDGKEKEEEEQQQLE